MIAIDAESGEVLGAYNPIGGGSGKPARPTPASTMRKNLSLARGKLMAPLFKLPLFKPLLVALASGKSIAAQSPSKSARTFSLPLLLLEGKPVAFALSGDGRYLTWSADNKQWSGVKFVGQNGTKLAQWLAARDAR